MIRRVGRIAAFIAFATALFACAGHGTTSNPGVLPQAMSPAFGSGSPSPSPVPILPEPPVVSPQNHVVTVSLQAEINIATELPAFFYNGQAGVAPTIFANPGDTIVLDLLNSLPGPGVSGDMNLHFHGLTVSPNRPADDVLTMLAMPGQTLHYVVPIPKTQEPGLYWYHPHVFQQTDAQVGKDGMSGAIVIGGLERRVRGLANMKAHVMIVRATGLTDSGARTDGEQMEQPQAPVINKPCVGEPGYTVSLNGVVRPIIPFTPGQSQLFRVINATGHKTLKLAVDNEQLQLVATDGVALDTYPGTGPTETLPFIIVPPAGRAEFIVSAPASGTAKFRTRCYFSGPGGDPDPEITLGTLQTTGKASLANARPVRLSDTAPVSPDANPLPPPVTTRTITLSEGPKLMFINGKSFQMSDPPMYVAKSGTVEKWIVTNVTQEVHDFHVHQVHFVVSAINGAPVSHPYWADTVVVPHQLGNRPGTVTLLVDFRNPVVRGTFMFHCHILDHEDRGMMATIKVV